MEDFDNSGTMRRSSRNPALSLLERPETKKLLVKIDSNHPDTIILKIKNEIVADINSLAFDEIIKALHNNNVCQVIHHCANASVSRFIIYWSVTLVRKQMYALYQYLAHGS